jgi:hypothetical protein
MKHRVEVMHNDPDIIIDFEMISLNERWEVGSDTRHGKKGFRVCRYLPTGGGNYKWDESYMFFTSLDEVYKAIHDPKLQSQGRRDF